MVFCNKKLPIIRATNRPKYANRSFIVPCISPTKVQQMLCSHPFCEHPLSPRTPKARFSTLWRKLQHSYPRHRLKSPKIRGWSVWSIPYQYVSLQYCGTLGLFAVEGEGDLPPLLERQDIVLHASVITIVYLQRSPDLSADVFLN